MEQRWDEIEGGIHSCSSLTQLRSLREDFHRSFDASLALKEPEDAVKRTNEIHDALIAKAVSFAEPRVSKEMSYNPLAGFSVLLFGSGGRREQSMWSDQDNGLVYEALPSFDQDKVQAYVAKLGETIQACLEAVGYPPCEGGVIVGQPLWRRSLAEWEETFKQWVDESSFESIRHLLVAADARSVSGDGRIALQFTASYLTLVRERPQLVHRMLQNTLRHKVLIGVLGNLLTEPYGEDAGGIDIKYGAYIPMVNAVRLLALHHRIAETSTLERIRALSRDGQVEKADAERWEEAFLTVLRLREMLPHQLANGMYTTRGKLSAAMLTKEVKRELRQALRIGAELQQHVKKTIVRRGG